MWLTNAENFKKISWFLFEIKLNNQTFVAKKWTPVVHYDQKCATGVHLLQQIFGYLAINQTKIKISSWNFQHLFITSLCKFDEKILAKTQTACLPRPISAETLDVSSDCICWDISKRKKLVRFWTHLSTLMEGISNIFKKMAFWNFSNECSVQVLHDVHAIPDDFSSWKYLDCLLKINTENF